MCVVTQTVNIYQRRDYKKLPESRKSQMSSWSFRLEGVLHNVSQEEVYTRVCKQVVLGALDGYNGRSVGRCQSIGEKDFVVVVF